MLSLFEMSLRGCGKAIRILILSIIISTSITISEPRNIQEQNGFHPPAVNGGTNLIDELKHKLKRFLSSTSEVNKNNLDSKADSETQQNVIDVYEPTENIPDNESPQYRHLATPHPTLQTDGLGYDYKDNTSDNHEPDDSHYDSKNNDGKTNDETGIDLNTEESKDTNAEKEDSDREVWIPDCDIPPYPDMLQKTQTNSPEENDENGEDLNKEGSDVNRGTESAGYPNDSAFNQKLEDELIEELLDGSSGDMTSENIGETEIGSNVNDIGETVSIKAEDDFLKKLLELKNTLGSMLSNEAPPQLNLGNIMREVSEVLDDRFGEVQKMHKKMRVRDLFGREKVKKLQEYHKKTSVGSPDDSDNVLLELKKARKRLKLITKNNDDDLLPDYIEVMQELISKLKTAKNVVRGIKDKATNDEELSVSDDPHSSAMDTMSSIDENSGDEIKMKSMDPQLIDRVKEYGKQVLGSKLKNRKRSKNWKVIDTLDSDSFEVSPNEIKIMKEKLRNHLRKQMKSRNDKWKLGRFDSSSLEDLETELIKKQKKKKEKKDKKREKRSFGTKIIEDL